MTTPPDSLTTPAARVAPPWLSSRLYATLWRLHFYAGIVTAPLVLWLCITGILYIVSPQVEPLIYRHLYVVDVEATAASFDDQLAAAQRAFPNMVATGFHPSMRAGRTAYVMMATPEEARMTGHRHGGPTDSIEVFVNPYTAAVVGWMRADAKYSRWMGALHGSMYLGWFGRLLTELGTVWTLALLLTGLYLWFPKRPGQVWGVWLTRIRSWRGRMWWRDFHSVGGMYTAALVAAFLVTALMISFSTGAMFALTRVALNQAAAPAAPRTLQSQRTAAGQRVALQDLSAVARMAGMERSYMINLPRTPVGLYTLSADNGMGSPTLRKDISIDQFTGDVRYTTGWSAYPWLLKLTVIGLGFHFGALFGVVGQVLGILACAAPIFFVISGVVMWWQRKPAHAWGVPKVVEGGWQPFPRALVAMIVVLGVVMPTFGASLVLALMVDAAVQRLAARRSTVKTTVSSRRGGRSATPAHSQS